MYPSGYGNSMLWEKVLEITLEKSKKAPVISKMTGAF